ncbi:MAG: hypothetical protein R2684_09105 [Pyrinomonadaceae bacterium]
MIEVLNYFALCLVAIILFCQIRNTLEIRRAENHMADKIHSSYGQQIERLRDDLLEFKSLAKEAGAREMDRFYEIEHELNRAAETLGRLERQLIAQGLQQPSGRGRLEYMLKLVDMSIANV